jgi:hypothetical protein
MNRSKKDIEEFILINHMFYTAQELAEELDISIPTVSVYTARLKVRPITPKEQAVEFIKKHKDWSIERLAEYLGYNATYIHDLKKEAGVYVKKEPQPFGPAPKKEKFVRVRSEFNQTHSPFRFADDLRGIRATKEPQNMYPEIVRL